MTTAEYKKAQAEITEKQNNLQCGSDEYRALTKESNRLYAERQRELKAERKALREQMKALRARLEEVEEQIW